MFPNPPSSILHPLFLGTPHCPFACKNNGLKQFAQLPRLVNSFYVRPGTHRKHHHHFSERNQIVCFSVLFVIVFMGLVVALLWLVNRP
jgi:hypothetical protein